MFFAAQLFILAASCYNLIYSLLINPIWNTQNSWPLSIFDCYHWQPSATIQRQFLQPAISSHRQSISHSLTNAVSSLIPDFTYLLLKQSRKEAVAMLPLNVIVCIEQTALPQMCDLFRFLLCWIPCQHHRNNFPQCQPNQCTYTETVTIRKLGFLWIIKKISKFNWTSSNF